MTKRLSGLLLGAGLFAFTAVLFLQTYKVRNFPGTRFGAELWPRAILICLGVLAVALVIHSLRRPDGAERSGTTLSELIARESIALTVFGCFAAFLWLVPRLGAYPSGGLFVLAVLTAIGPKTLRAFALHAAITVGMTLLLWALFAYLLKVIAPVGRWWSLI